MKMLNQYKKIFFLVGTLATSFQALAIDREVDFAGSYNGGRSDAAEQQGFGVGYTQRWNVGSGFALGPTLRAGQIGSSLKRNNQAWDIDSRWLGLGGSVRYQSSEQDSFSFSILGARSLDKARVDDNGANYFRRVDLTKISSTIYEADLLYRHFFTEALHMSVGTNYRMQRFDFSRSESNGTVELEDGGGYSLANDSSLTDAQKAIVPKNISIQTVGIVFGFGVTL